eukprot:288231-Chlamydomonas_euryale.AAC.3
MEADPNGRRMEADRNRRHMKADLNGRHMEADLAWQTLHADFWHVLIRRARRPSTLVQCGAARVCG